MKKANFKIAALAASAAIGALFMVASPASADIVSPYGPGVGFVRCPDGTTRPVYGLEAMVPPTDPNYDLINARNQAKKDAAFRLCSTSPNDPTLTHGGIGVHGTVVTEAPIKDLHSNGQVVVDSNIVPPAPDLHPSDPLPPRQTPSLLCCQRPGQQTTLNLSTGAAVWTVRAPSSTTDAPTINSANAAWTTTVIPAAHWISPVGNPTTPGTFVYSTKFNAGECRVRCTINISGKFLVDNRGILKVDGVTVASSVGTPMYGFLPGSVTPFSYNLPVVSGTHTITFEAFNQSGPTGADIQLMIRRLCAGRPGVPLQELSAGPAANIVPTPANTVGTPGGGSAGCNPNNLQGNANPC